MLRDDLLHGAIAAARYSGLSPRMIYRLCDQNEIPFVRLGRRLFFRKSELEHAFEGSQREDAPKQADLHSPIEGEIE